MSASVPRSVRSLVGFSPGEGRGEVVTSEGESVPGKGFHYGRLSDRRADRHPTGSSPPPGRLSDRRADRHPTGSSPVRGRLSDRRADRHPTGSSPVRDRISDRRADRHPTGSSPARGRLFDRRADRHPTGSSPVRDRFSDRRSDWRHTSGSSTTEIKGRMFEGETTVNRREVPPRTRVSNWGRERTPKTIGKYRRSAATTQIVKLRVQIMTHPNEALVSKRHAVRHLI